MSVKTLTVFRLVNRRHLRRGWRRSLLTVAGIAASTALVVAIGIAHATIERTIDATAVGFGGAASLAVTPLGSVPLQHDAVRTIRAMPGVAAAVPLMRQITSVRNGSSTRRAMIVGITPRGASLLAPVLGPAAARLAERTRSGVVLSAALADALGARAGGTIRLDAPSGAVRLRVDAQLSDGPAAAMNGGQLALLPLRAAQRLFGRPGEADVIYVLTHPEVSSVEARRSIESEIGRTVAVGRPGAEAAPYKRTFESIASMTRLVRMLALLVAVFLVVNTIGTSLAERRRELSLIAMLGARERHLVSACLLEAAALGIVGGALGAGLGCLLARTGIDQAEQAYAGILPITSGGSPVVTAGAVATGVGFGAVVALLGAALAARRILSVQLIAALRPGAPYAPGRAGATPSRALVAGGLASLGCAIAIVAVAPIGLDAWVAGLVLVLTLGGMVQLLPWGVWLAGRALGAVARGTLGAMGRIVAANLVHARSRITMASAALAISAAMAVASASALGSFEHAVRRAAAGWYVAPLYIRASGTGLLASDQPLPAVLERRLSAVPGVREAYPMRFALLNQGGRQSALLGVPVAEAARRGDTVMDTVPAGRRSLVSALRRGEVLVSRLAARRRGLEPGDRLTLPTLRGRRGFRVAGVIGDFTTTDSIYVERRVYERVTGDAKADRFAIMLEPGSDAGVVRRRLERLLAADGLPAVVITRQQAARLVVDAVQGFFSLAHLVELAALLIAGIVVMNTMLAATLERRRELGVQRLLGVGGPRLGGGVIAEAAAIAAMAAGIAIVLGLVLGLAMTLLMARQLAWDITFRPDVAGIVLAAAGTIAVGALAAAYPGWMATRPRLIELLSME